MFRAEDTYEGTGNRAVTAWQFYRHMPVSLENGDLLGHVLEVGHDIEYIHVQQGRVLFFDWYVPASAIRDVSAQGVRLNVDRAALRANRWNVPAPQYLSRQGATPGYEYTSGGDAPPSGTNG